MNIDPEQYHIQRTKQPEEPIAQCLIVGEIHKGVPTKGTVPWVYSTNADKQNDRRRITLASQTNYISERNQPMYSTNYTGVREFSWVFSRIEEDVERQRTIRLY